jgi:hypothetical protein
METLPPTPGLSPPPVNVCLVNAGLQQLGIPAPEGCAETVAVVARLLWMDDRPGTARRVGRRPFS